MSVYSHIFVLRGTSVTPDEVDIGEHFEALRSHLDGKDPRRLGTSARGQAVIVLMDDGGRIHRLTIHLKPKGVQIRSGGGTPVDGESFAVIRGTVPDWMAFYTNAGPETLEALKLYGDMELVAAIGELMVQTRTFLDIRAGGTS